MNTGPLASPQSATITSRVMRFPLIRIVLALLAIAVPFIAVRFLLNAFVTGRPLRSMGALLLAAVTILAYRAYVRYVEERTVSELSCRHVMRELGAGMLLGGLLFSVTIGVLALAGAYAVDGSNGWQAALATVPTFVLGAVLEEVAVRGVIFRILEHWLGSVVALILSAVLFGLLHVVNPGATLLSAGAIMLEAGILLAAAYMLTRRLWLCMGIHFAWNFTQGGVFSATVSGGESRGWLQSSVAGPAWLTGGAFGPEASVIAVAVCTGAGLALLAAAWRRGRFIQPSWKVKSAPAA